MLWNQLPKAAIKNILTEAWLNVKGFKFTFCISLLTSVLIVATFFLPKLLPIFFKNTVHLSTIFQSTQVTSLLCIMGCLLAAIFLIGLKIQAVNNINDKSARTKQLFSFFCNPLPLIPVVLLFSLPFIFPPLSFLILISFFLQFADTLIIKNRVNFIEACRLSFLYVRKNFSLILGTNFAIYLILILATLIPLFHIRFWTLILIIFELILYFPFAANTYGCLYKRIFIASQEAAK